jgi:predicted nucleic acid-binding protein
LSIVVSDTSPIRALAHLGHLDLLHALFGEVLIPPAVVAELEQPRSKLPPILIQKLVFVRIEAPRNRAAVEELLLTLGPGEAEAVVLAIEVGADAILIDESAGRGVARNRGLLPLGVLGILLRAKQRTLIGSLRPLLDRLQNELGFFISSALRAEVLNNAGE